MRTFRTAIVVATAAFALSWSGASRAEDDVSSKKGTTKSGTGSPSTGQQSSSTSSPDLPDTPGTPPRTTPTTPGPTTDTSWGTGSDRAWGTGYGSAQPYMYQPYQQTQQQPATQPATQPPTATYGTTTTTSAIYDERAGADTEKRKPNRWMLMTGSIIFLGTYAASATVGAISDAKGDNNLFIPVVGPWLDVAQRDCKLGECSTSEDVAIAHLIGSGAAQAAGIGIMIGSFFVGERGDGRPVPQKKVLDTNTAKFRVLPLGLRSGAGIGAFGTF